MKMKQLEDKFFHRAIKGKKKISKVVIGFLKFQCSQIVHDTHNIFYHYSVTDSLYLSYRAVS